MFSTKHGSEMAGGSLALSTGDIDGPHEIIGFVWGNGEDSKGFAGGISVGNAVTKAIKNLKAEARSLKADAVIKMSLAFSDFKSVDQFVSVIAYGTAVRRNR